MNPINTLRHYISSQPASSIVIAAIWIVCLIPIPDSPLGHVRFIDKWTHFAMYATLSAVIMAEYGHRENVINKRRLLVGGLVLPVMMGGFVELAQAYLTAGTRSGDWLDFAANTTGALIGAVIGIPLARFLATRNKGA